MRCAYADAKCEAAPPEPVGHRGVRCVRPLTGVPA
jgi:hypothetical protein